MEDASSGANAPEYWRWPLVGSCLNPKAVTSDDLYGCVHPVTKEPYDGIIAKIMRDFKNATGAQTSVPKWVILDGDIDAEWIESMNTVSGEPSNFPFPFRKPTP